MSDLLRTFDELLFALRREGFKISTGQAIVAAKALALVGLQDKSKAVVALEAVLLDDRRQRARFRDTLEALLAGEHAHAQDLFGRLRHAGFAPNELDALRELLTHLAQNRAGQSGGLALRAVLGDESELETLLRSAGVGAVLARMTNAGQVGFFSQRLSTALGTQRASSSFARLRGALSETLGHERGEALYGALRRELERLRHRIRAHVESVAIRLSDEQALARATGASLSATDPTERSALRRAVRAMGERLRGVERLRSKRARRGRVDLRRTLVSALSTGGAPVVLARRRRRRDRPKVFVLTDVSDSMRAVAPLLLELVAQIHRAFRRTRSFVFVRELEEVTALLEGAAIDPALTRILSGSTVATHETSSYERALASFETRFGDELDRRTTLVVLGDGRTNFTGDGLTILRRLSVSVGTLLWITPEGKDTWGAGDCAMHRYAEVATQTLVARTTLELEAAARTIARRR